MQLPMQVGGMDSNFGALPRSPVPGQQREVLAAWASVGHDASGACDSSDVCTRRHGAWQAVPVPPDTTVTASEVALWHCNKEHIHNVAL